MSTDGMKAEATLSRGPMGTNGGRYEGRVLNIHRVLVWKCPYVTLH